MNIVVIPARGGSKGIVGKNLFQINGKPLLHYTTSACLNSNLVNRTIVSTNDTKISKIAKEIGAEVIMRPKSLSTDSASISPLFSTFTRYVAISPAIGPESPLNS